MAQIPTAELEALRSAAADLTDVIVGLTAAKKEEAAASNEAANADRKKAAAATTVGGALGRLGTSALSTANAAYGLAKTFASIAESGRQFAEKTGATATRGAQFQMDINKILLSDARKFGADQQLIAEQIRGAATSFADVFVGAAAGMQISARGSAEFARSLSTGFKSEFTLTSQSMRALVTVGAATTKEFDAFRKASGRAGLSSGQFANLVNKNSLSFMLYGPNFARAAVNAERLGISLATVQRAQESMVTNLDGTIDTIAQLNQLGAGIDFGTLITLAETQGPEATLKYLQSTIPPSLFQSASTRALISKLGIPLEDLLKSQGSVQASAADRIEQAFSEVAQPASNAAKSLANLNKDLKALDEAKVMDILNGVVSVGKAIWGLVGSLGAFIIAVVKATISLFGLGGPGGGLFAKIFPTKVPPVAPAATATTAAASSSMLPPLLVRLNTILTDGLNAIKGVFSTGFNSFKGAVSSGLSSIGGAASRMVSTIANLPGIRQALSVARVGGGAVTSAVRAGGGAVGSVVGSALTKMGPVGVGSGALAAGFGAFEAYSRGIEIGLTKTESVGMGAAQGGMALIGTIIGGFGGPFGAILGGFMGNWLGKKMNEWFPNFGIMIGESFSKLIAPFNDLKNAITGMFDASVGLGPVIKAIAVVLGGTLATTFDILANTVSAAMSTLSGIIKLLSLDFGGALQSFRNSLASILSTFDFIPGVGAIVEAVRGTPATPATPTKGDDVVASAGYGNRTLVTPNGAVALNNRDTVVAYADDMISGIKTYSLGTLSRQMSGDTGELGRKVEDLITVLRDANTTIQVGNTTQQVPRLAVARVGAYDRYGR